MSTSSLPSDSSPKKGNSCLAIGGIGCAAILAFAGIGVFMFAGKACSRFNEVAGEFQKNPAKAAAMIALRINPDIEVVSTDDTKGEITIKDKKSGKVLTVSYDDIKDGKLSVKDSEGNETTIDGSTITKDGKVTVKDSNGNETTISGSGGQDSVIHTKGPDGEMTIGSGGAASSPPAWVPTYPGAKFAEGGMRMEKAGKLTGMSISETTDALAKVRAFYEEKLTAAGYKVDSTAMSSDGKDNVVLSSTKQDGSSSINAVLTQEDGKTKVTLNYDGPK